MTATTEASHRAIEAVWRIEQARLIAGLARMLRGDVGLAEELAQDALLAALECWPQTGIPERPGAWLMATAKHRAIDQVRRHKRLERKHEELGQQLAAEQARIVPDLGAALVHLGPQEGHEAVTADAPVAGHGQGQQQGKQPSLAGRATQRTTLAVGEIHTPKGMELKHLAPI